MKEVYLISGLGADERLFRNIHLAGARIHIVKWAVPAKRESWESYASRLTRQITFAHPIIIGVSMGGMMAVEISKLIPVEKVIVISGAVTRGDLPPSFRMLRWTRVHQWLPFGLLQFSGKCLARFIFGTCNREETRLLHQVIRRTDPRFFRWAWQRVITWKNEYLPSSVFQLHGRKDHMLPLRYIRNPDHILDKGTHFMIVHEGEEISRIVQQVIDT